MIKLSKEWFKNHNNCSDKGKLGNGFITNKVILELGFNNTDDFITYVNHNYYLHNYQWCTMINDGIWIYPEDVLCDILSEYNSSLFS